MEGKPRGMRSSRVKRAIVADLVRLTLQGSGIQADAAVIVVRFPGGIGGLEQKIRMAAVVADDEDDVAGAACIGTSELGDINPGHRVAWDGPRPRDAPVAAVQESGRGVVEALRLSLRQSCRRKDRRHFTRAEAAIIAEAINIEPIVARVGLHLEGNRAALIEADVVGEALDGGIARPNDVPIRGSVALQAVLRDDGVRGTGAARWRGPRCRERQGVGGARPGSEGCDARDTRRGNVRRGDEGEELRRALDRGDAIEPVPLHDRAADEIAAGDG